MPCRANLESVLPSTSRGQNNLSNDAPTSPISPTGRIAKRNAQLINEMDLKNIKRTSVFSETILGAVLDFDTYDVSTKCPVIQKMLDTEDNTIKPEHLNLLQKQIENLIADNVDYQKRLHGEISYLNTGEYPTDSLSDRLMPMYTLRPRSPVEQKKCIVVGSTADLGLNSSPEEDEENPSVVDVPQRFWNWTREYLRHITDDYVTSFKEKVVCRFNKDALVKFLHDDVVTKRKNGSEYGEKKSCNGTLNGYTNYDNHSSPKCGKRFKRRLSKSEEDCPLPAKCKPTDSLSNGRSSNALLAQAVSRSMAQKNGDLSSLKKSKQNGKNDNGDDSKYENGKSSEDSYDCDGNAPLTNGYHCDNTAASNRIKFLSNNNNNNNNNGNKTPVSILTNLRELGSALSSYGAEKGLVPSEFSLKDFLLLEGDECNNDQNNYAFSESDGDLDEVSREIKRKQAELMQLADATSPLIDEIFERIQSEYALYETSRRLDIIDDKLFELGSKYDGITSFTKEQRQECAQTLVARDKILKSYFCLAKDVNSTKSNGSLSFTGKLNSPCKTPLNDNTLRSDFSDTKFT